MMKYEKYKNSGVQWLGEIPVSWLVKRHIDLSIINEKSLDSNTKFDYIFKYIDIGNVNQQGISNNPEVINYSEAPSRARRILKKNDTIISTVRTYLRAVAFIDFDAKDYIASTGFAVLSPKRKIIPEYLAFFCQSDLFIDLVVKNSKGVSYPAINATEFACLPCLYPPLQEQTAIAHYLDTKTQSIDKKISLLEQKIISYKALRKTLINDTVTKGLDKNVKLKNSGIEWIGEIPEHWKVKRFKEAINKYTTGGTPSTSETKYFEGTNIWVTIGDIDDKKFIGDSKIKLTSEAIQNNHIVKTPKGSLLYSFKLSIGKMAFTNCDLYTNEAILSIFPNKKIDLMFFYYMLSKYMDLASTENIYGAKMLNQKLIANALLVYPPKQEQTAIAEYLDKKTRLIDDIVSNIETQIEKLKELRKTLINDVVTGKIKVSL